MSLCIGKMTFDLEAIQDQIDQNGYNIEENESAIKDNEIRIDDLEELDPIVKHSEKMIEELRRDTQTLMIYHEMKMMELHIEYEKTLAMEKEKKRSWCGYFSKIKYI